MGFNLFTLFIFLTAPLQWITDHLFLLTLYVLFCLFLILIGYIKGNRTGGCKSTEQIDGYKILHKLTSKSLSFIFIFYSFTFLIKYAYLLRFSPFDIEGMVLFLLIGIADPNLGYALSLDTMRATTIPWTLYFLISIINQLFFIVGFIGWEKMYKWQKILFVGFLLIEIFFWFGRATNMGVIILITTFLFLRLYKIEINKSAKIKNFKLLLVILVSLTISIWVFSYNLSGRKGSQNLDYQSFSLGNSKVYENSVVLSFIPEQLHETYMFAVYYLAQGYYHTSLAFDLDFKPTYFLGNNPAIISLAEIFGIDAWKDTYVYRLNEKGVDPLIQWHSAYLWYASDVSFLGVPVVLFLLGYFFGFSWGFSSNNSDLLSKIMFVFLGNMLLFLFANNSYLSMVFYSFMFVLPMWYFTRVKTSKSHATYSPKAME